MTFVDPLQHVRTPFPAHGDRRCSLPGSLAPGPRKPPLASRSVSVDWGSGGGNEGFLPSKEETKTWLKSALDCARRGMKWVAGDFRKSHLLWVKVIFLFQVRQSYSYA